MINMATPTYSNEDELIQALQELHMSELLGFEDDGAEEQGANDIDIQLSNTENEDYTMGVSEYLQSQLRGLIEDYKDIFSYSQQLGRKSSWSGNPAGDCVSQKIKVHSIKS